MKALVTGFDPFGGEAINPAYEAVKKMKDRIGGCEIVKLEIPTVFERSLKAIEEAIEREKPDIVLCVGQAGGRFGMSIEKVGINLDEARIPDNDGNSPSGTPIRPDGETAYFSNLPVKAITEKMRCENIPAQISYTAGTYVCNHVLYGLMYMISTKYGNLKGGFIHVPFLPEQVMDKKNMPFMELDSIKKGLELAIEATLDTPEDIEFQAGTTH